MNWSWGNEGFTHTCTIKESRGNLVGLFNELQNPTTHCWILSCHYTNCPNESKLARQSCYLWCRSKSRDKKTAWNASNLITLILFKGWRALIASQGRHVYLSQTFTIQFPRPGETFPGINTAVPVAETFVRTIYHAPSPPVLYRLSWNVLGGRPRTWNYNYYPNQHTRTLMANLLMYSIP